MSEDSVTLDSHPRSPSGRAVVSGLLAVLLVSACSDGGSDADTASGPTPASANEDRATVTVTATATVTVTSPEPTPAASSEGNSIDSLAESVLLQMWLEGDDDDRAVRCDLVNDDGDLYLDMTRDALTLNPNMDGTPSREVIEQFYAERCGDVETENGEEETDAGSGAGTSTESGSRADPYPPGEPSTLPNWEVTVGPTTRDWEAAVMAENQFNDPAGSGNSMVRTQVDLTFTGRADGEEYDSPWLSLDFAFVGSDGREYAEDCGVIPEDVGDIDDLFQDASASGNVCMIVATDAIEGGTWYVQESFGDQERYYYATD
ncbi:hypothetical protein [Ornithinimicrobium sediminis]|uniref:hypothetical protein n=1 Tax=Ornithinimicrobium sediminis TaxID=2904603 RepID=UPI001E476E86|nr:hypothetical protein [Ornithinimicrobium sediminis]MCE0486375.1 hypothetical protein [Ornithinimicrobium sediminis]